METKTIVTNDLNTANLMSVQDFATYQRVDRRTVYNWINNKTVKQVEFLGKKWVDKSSFKKGV